MMHLVYDTETTGKWVRDASIMDARQPHLVQLAMRAIDDFGKCQMAFVALNSNIDFIPLEAQSIHHKTVADCKVFGIGLQRLCKLFAAALQSANLGVCFNTEYDWAIMRRAAWTAQTDLPLIRHHCVMRHMSLICAIPKKNPRYATPTDPYQWPKLADAHFKAFETMPVEQHDAMADVDSTERLFQYLLTTNRDAVIARIEEPTL